MASEQFMRRHYGASGYVSPESRNATTQKDEFDAVGKLVEQHRRLSMTPIVDDDYPEVRRDYELSLVSLIAKMSANGRFREGNVYGVRDLS